MRRLASLLFSGVLAVMSAGAAPAFAAHLAKVRVGTPALVNFTFLPLTVGRREGFFAKQGLNVQIIGFQGGTRLNQGIIAGDVDLATTSGSNLAYLAKGVPAKAVAATAGPPLFLCTIVPYHSSIKGPDGLKGKKVAVTTSGSFTAWLMRRLEQEKHWGPNSITLVAIGASPNAFIAALKTHEVDAAVEAPALAFRLEEAKVGRMLFPASEILPTFLSNAIFATDHMIKAHPSEVRRFIKAWFETIHFMRTHKARTVAISRSLNHYDATVATKEYDTVMPMFRSNGRFNKHALAVVQEALVAIGHLKKAPDLSKYYTERFLPKS